MWKKDLERLRLNPVCLPEHWDFGQVTYHPEAYERHAWDTDNRVPVSQGWSDYQLTKPCCVCDTSLRLREGPVANKSIVFLGPCFLIGLEKRLGWETSKAVLDRPPGGESHANSENAGSLEITPWGAVCAL